MTDLGNRYKFFTDLAVYNILFCASVLMFCGISKIYSCIGKEFLRASVFNK